MYVQDGSLCNRFLALLIDRKQTTKCHSLKLLFQQSWLLLSVPITSSAFLDKHPLVDGVTQWPFFLVSVHSQPVLRLSCTLHCSHPGSLHTSPEVAALMALAALIQLLFQCD